MKKTILLGLLALCVPTLSSPVPIESRALNFAEISNEARSTSEKHIVDRADEEDKWSTDGNPGDREERSLNFVEISHEARSTSENHSVDRRDRDDTWSTRGNPPDSDSEDEE